ncbi:MAG: glycosyltransferase family 4 protein [Elusimicrobia bacterium]|nr:glycosyltransferase family 4 protein [Elusimicrobiota bacterium]
MKRVVMLTPNFYPHIGGAEKQALELSKALKAQGAQVMILTRRLDGLAPREFVSGILVRRLAAFSGAGPLIDSAVFLLSSFAFLMANAIGYDAVHVHLAGSPAIAAALAARLLKKRAVVKIGGGRGIGEIAASSKTRPGRLKLWLLKRLKPRFVCVARDLLDELREGIGAEAALIPNGVDLKTYRPPEAEEKIALRRGLCRPGLLFLYVGRLAPEKRLCGFLRSFAEALGEAKTEASFFMAGSGPEEGAIREEISRLGLEGRAKVLEPTHDIAKLYAAADIFVLPSVSEGLSNALLEAMATGLAVLASRVGGTREAVSEGRTGLLFDPNDPAEERRQIVKLLTESGLAFRLGRSARADAEARYSIDRVAARYLELY